MRSPVRDLTRISPASNKTQKFSCQLEDMADSLRDKLEQLRSKKRRIEMRLKLEETAYKKPTHKVIEWLYKADTIGAEVDKVIIEADRELADRRTVCCGPWNWRSSSMMGSSVYEKLRAVNQMLTEDDFDVVVQRTPHPHVDVISVAPTVDFESNMDDVWRCLEDESLQIIAIFGMAGVGKTTLLKKIKDDLEKRTDTPVVIWLSASKETRLDAIQKDIAKQLGVFQKNASNRKYILLIDGLWARLDLSRIVVPYLNSTGYRVVFTTRLEAVCDVMAADAKLKLNCLSDDEALKLFWKNAGGGIRGSFPQPQQLADHVNASLCQGLPLALVAVGRAMAGMPNPAFEEFSGMKHVFRVLEPSYDSLDDDLVRRLFIYCAILPGEIKKDELIRLWIGEGFVESSDGQRGEYFVKKLAQACLLEYDEFNDSVGMHSVIRAFGLYLCHERVETENNIVVRESKSENLHDADRISMDGEIDISTLQWSCPKLRSLFIINNGLIAFPQQFFGSMHSLEVLNLSNNFSLVELPRSIDVLTNLHYLSLSFTSIRELPAEVRLLKKLKVLLADYTENLKMIPEGHLLSISSLKIFSKLGDRKFKDIMLLEELKKIEGIDEISVSLFTYQAVGTLLHSQKLQSCIWKLTLKKINSLKIPVSFLARMAQLENLVIEDCTDLEFEMDASCYHVLSIQGLWIKRCHQIDNLKWLIFAPGLQVLDLRSCRLLVEVIGSDFEPQEITEIDERLGIFSNLERMHLEDLRHLECICPQVLRFPALGDVNIIDCPMLSVLPFDGSEVSNRRGARYLHLENNAREIPVGLMNPSLELKLRTRDRDEIELEEGNESSINPIRAVINEIARPLLEKSEDPMAAATTQQRAATYDVFVNFSRADTGRNFTAHIYSALALHGIHFFHDDEIVRGDMIESQVFRAIRESKLSIIVFSKNYAFSTWCLDELVVIMERRKFDGHLVLPVFYNVDPYEVSDQRGSYAEAFALHAEHFKEHISRVEGWRAALREVAEYSGMVLQDGPEPQFIDRLVREVEDRLNRTTLNVDPYLVGIEYRISQINSWILEESDVVEIAGIWGIGGIGKTTIAKIVYKVNFDRFDAGSFLANVKETSKQPNGLVLLQRKFLSDLAQGKVGKKYNVNKGFSRIQHKLWARRVLLILDDVDRLDEYDAVVGKRKWFHPGSKIIITTRNKHLLKFHGFTRSFEVEKLDDKESLELFCWHAFGQNRPAEGYEENSKKMAHYCNGLPLDLQRMGSFLSGKSSSDWESALARLEKNGLSEDSASSGKKL